MTRDRSRAFSTLRPLAAALALSGTTAGLHAVTLVPPGEMQSTVGALREDGTRLRTSLSAWHADALQNAAPPSPHTTTRLVTSCADDGEGSLRAVVMASASGDTVDLSHLSCSAITLETGAIAIRIESLTLIGPQSRALAIDGNHVDRVFLHYGSNGFLLRNLTVRNGYDRATGFHLAIGGCIASSGYVTLDHTAVTGCYAGGEGAYGGAIYAYSLIMSSSTLSHNLALGVHPTTGTAAFGGAAFVYQVDLVGSTVTGNHARHRFNPNLPSYDIGGGICTIHGGLVVNSTIDSNYAYTVGGGLATFDNILVRNSTLSGNTAPAVGGGGLFVRSPALLDARNSTVTANAGHQGGGILFSSQNASLQSTIVSDNTADIRSDEDLAAFRTATTIDGANNLIGTVSNTIAIPNATLRGSADLLPLLYNGGPTRTHALRPGSAAIDAGNNASGLPSDQRGSGFARVVGAAADIGAFELGTASPDVSAASVPTVSTWAEILMFGLISLLGMRATSARRKTLPSRRRNASAHNTFLMHD
ncbi:MAG TPA: choice-of-anchor Q domain-containing protein [Rhodanobacteraceae bacterium]|nr:choice-of-anchor Q domain-containing protein [Rhodanobacteraceae bacterium]